MRLMANEFALTASTPGHAPGRSPPAIGWGLMLGMAPVMLVYWLLLTLVMIGGGLLRFAR